MLKNSIKSSDSDTDMHIRHHLETMLPTLAHRKPVCALPTLESPPAGAWNPCHLSIQLPISGSIRLSTPQQQELRTINNGHVLIVCPNSWSPRTHTTTRHHLAISIGTSIQIDEFKTPARTTGKRVSQLHLSHQSPALNSVVEACHRCAKEHPTPEILHGLTIPLIELITRSIHNNNTIVPKVESFLEQNCQRPLTREQVAKNFKISSDHLNRLIREERGQTFVELFQHIRLQQVRSMLLTSPQSLDTIAQQTGFGSASYLIRVFRKHVGCTPKQWYRLQETSGAS